MSAALRMTVPMEVGICCADLDALQAFYTDIMGLTLVNRVSVPADKAQATGLTRHGYEVARLQTSYGERIKLLQPAAAPQAAARGGAILDRQGATYLTFIVRDLPGVVRDLQARGVAFDSAPAPMEVRPAPGWRSSAIPKAMCWSWWSTTIRPPTGPIWPAPNDRTNNGTNNVAHLIKLPSVAADTSGGTLHQWLKQEGDTVAVGDALAEIETEKAIVEINAEHAGVLGRIVVQAGAASVPVNTVIGVLLAQGEDASGIDRVLAEAGAAATPSAAPAPTAAPAPAPAAETPAPAARLFASPLARRLAAQWQIDLQSVAGTGPRGRIVRRDVEAARERAPPPRPRRWPPAPPRAACRTPACAAPSPAA